MRVAPAWKERAQRINCQWGNKGKEGRRDSEISARIQPFMGGAAVNCRPMERIGSKPYPLPFDPTEVFVLTVAAELMTSQSGKTRKWVEETLDFRLRISERLVRTCISTSFGHSASIYPTTARTLISHFLLPPMSSIAGFTRFNIPKSTYSPLWPDESARPIRDCIPLQNILDSGNGQRDTLIVLGHHCYDHIGWIGWARQMCNMSNNSMFGIGYTFVFVDLDDHEIYSCSWCRADQDVKFGRNRSIFGHNGLDYILAIQNCSLQLLSQYLAGRLGQEYVSYYIYGERRD
jgi:hypothetical protein